MNSFPQTLRHWRKARRYSQLDLALEAEVSARHISFLETGRARPSRDMIMRLGEAMDLPLSARNSMLGHAGFTPRYGSRDWQDAEMEPVREALLYTMNRHAPYPAIALDQNWSIVRMNDAATRLYGFFGLSEGDSMLELMLSDRLPPLISNWPEVAHLTAQRLRTESATQGGNPDLDRAARYLALEGASADLSGTNAVIPIMLSLGDQSLSLFGTLAQFGTPDDVTVDTLRIELFFPADAPTKALLEAMAEKA